MLTIEDLMGFEMGDVIETLDEFGWVYDWVMDQLHVSDCEGHWMVIEFDDSGLAIGWEAV